MMMPKHVAKVKLKDKKWEAISQIRRQFCSCVGFVFVRLFWAVVWECSKNLDQHRGSKNRVVKELVRFGIYMSWLVIWIWGKVSVWFPTDAVTKYHKLHGIKEEHWESLNPTLVSLGYN